VVEQQLVAGTCECGGGVFDVVELAAGSEHAGDFGDGVIAVVL
jgi:hypothetical protein